jgi:predicted DNA-binding transcriptional regulator YafY
MGGPADEDPTFLSGLQESLVSRRQVDIEYTKPGAERRWRRVHPYGLVAKAGTWYLLAGTDEGRRRFRVSRISGVTLADEPLEMPEGFDLADEWEQVQRDFSASLRTVDVEIDVTERAVLRLTTFLGAWVATTDEGPRQPGWRRLRASFPHVEAAVVNLAPFGGDVRVASPVELRRRLRQVGEALVRSNADEASPVPATDERH